MSGSSRRVTPPISTHAPARGATWMPSWRGPSSCAISTHAPARGATCRDAWYNFFSGGFLLTPLREGRRKRHLIIKNVNNFYSRPCERGDAPPSRPQQPTTSFLLTPLREGRPGFTYSPVSSASFLLTPLREGRRMAIVLHLCTIIISTHAPARGATFSAFD